MLESLKYLVLRFLMNKPRTKLYCDGKIIVIEDGVNRVIIDNQIILIRVSRDSSYFRTTIARFNWQSRDGKYFSTVLLSSDDMYQTVWLLCYKPSSKKSLGEGSEHFYDESIDTTRYPYYNETYR